jgi:hypothetical protein
LTDFHFLFPLTNDRDRQVGMHHQICGGTAKYAFGEPALGGPANDDLFGAIFDGDQIKRFCHVAMFDDAARLEACVLQGLDGRINDASGGDCQFLFPALVTQGVFFCRLKGEWGPLNHVNDKQFATAYASRHNLGM